MCEYADCQHLSERVGEWEKGVQCGRPAICGWELGVGTRCPVTVLDYWVCLGSELGLGVVGGVGS